MTAPEHADTSLTSVIEARTNLLMWPNEHPEVQKVISEYTDTMANSRSAIQEVKIEAAAAPGYLAPELSPVIGDLRPHLVDFNLSYSPLARKLLGQRDPFDLVVRLYGGGDGQESRITIGQAAYQKYDFDPHASFPSSDMQVLDDDELKLLFTSLAHYGSIDESRTLEHETHPLAVALEVAASLEASAKNAYSETRVVARETVGDVFASQITVARRRVTKRDGESAPKDILSVELRDSAQATLPIGYDASGSLVLSSPDNSAEPHEINLSRTLRYSFSQLPDKPAALGQMLLTLACAGDPNNLNDRRWLRQQIETARTQYLYDTRRIGERIIRAVDILSDRETAA